MWWLLQVPVDFNGQNVILKYNFEIVSGLSKYGVYRSNVLIKKNEVKTIVICI